MRQTDPLNADLSNADPPNSLLIAAIHDTPWLIVLVIAGGGNAAITDLLDVPGASRTLLEVRVPYAHSAMVDLLGGEPPDGAVSQPTAEAIAQACFRSRPLPGARPCAAARRRLHRRSGQ